LKEAIAQAFKQVVLFSAIRTTLLGFPEKGTTLSFLVVSAPSTETLGLKIA
jgi:hypothetical protein